MELYPFKSAAGLMEPVALIGHNVSIRYIGATPFYRRVLWLEPIVPFQFLNIGAMAAQVTSGRTQAVNLENFDGEFSQIRWWPLDDVQTRLFLPNTNGKIILKNLQIPVDKNIIHQDPDLHMTEIFIWEDRVPWFEAMNASDYGLGACRFRAMGFRYVTRKLSDIEQKRVVAGIEPCVHLPAAGVAGTVE